MKLPDEITEDHRTQPHEDFIFIYWSEGKSMGNHHDYEFKEVPVSRIQIEIEKHSDKLSNEINTI
jgi:hypothetical protein